MRVRPLNTVLAAALAIGAAHAQSPVAPGANADDHFERKLLLASTDPAQDLHAFSYLFADRLGRGPVVKNAPYSAETVSESVQHLPDGNVIARKTLGLVYRDAQGRVRQETGTGDAKSVYLSDPVADASFNLPAGAKSAVRLPRAATFEREGDRDVFVTRSKEGREVRIENGKVFVNGKEVVEGAIAARELKAAGKDVRVENGKVFIDGAEVKSGDGRRIVVRTLGDPGEGDGMLREEVRVQVVRRGEHTKELPVPPMPPMPPIPPGFPGAPGMHFNLEARPGGKAVVTTLGAKEFDGVRADGKRSVRTIAAGEIGNRNPIEIVTETWFAPDLQVTVLTRTSDPRAGETTYRLANIRRGEPPAELFRAPAEPADKSRK
jgi:hypothetical protein